MQAAETEIDGVASDVTALRDVLAREFEALKHREMDALKDLEQHKTEILERLQVHGPSFTQAEQLSERWVQLRDDLRVCRDMHFKNWQLLRRQIDVVQGTLQAMLGDSEPTPMLYDRMGHLGTRKAGRPWQFA